MFRRTHTIPSDGGRLMMKIVAAVVLFLAASFTAAAQQSWTYPLAPGDVAVFRSLSFTGGRSTVITVGTETAQADKNADAIQDTVQLLHRSGLMIPIPAWSEPWAPEYGMFATIDPQGMLWTWNGRSNAWRQEYPTRPPANDTLYILHSPTDSVRVVVLARTPVTLFDTLVAAFTIDIREIGHRRTLVIADGFGLVEATDSAGRMTLVNARIGGRGWNQEHRFFNYMPVCLGDVRHWSRTLIDTREPWLSGQWNAGDTLATDIIIGGHRYLRSTESGYAYHSDSTGIVGVWPATGDTLLSTPAYPTLGAVMGYMIVVDTSTVFAYGRQRRKLRCERAVIDNYGEEIWMEGLGRVYSYSWGYFGGEMTDTLGYFRICGEEYGTPLSSPPVPVAADALHLDCYPNPASASGSGITVRAGIPSSGAAYARLTVHDIHGRLVATLADGELSPGDHTVRFEPRGLAPGMYFCMLRSATGCAMRHLLIAR